LHSTMGLEPKLSGVNAVDQPVHAKENFSLRAFRVDALGHRHESHPENVRRSYRFKASASFRVSLEVSSIRIASKARAGCSAAERSL
jgi:hypothetical protein